jgi:RNA polymerase sigma-70 factor (ECF subfamily)
MEEDTPMASLTAVSEASPAASAWREWLEEHGPKLLLFARQQTRSHGDAEDVFQDALVKLVEKVRSGEFVGGQEAWQPYLYTTVGADAETGQFDAFNPWFESDSSDDETRDQLEKSLKELPQKFAEVITMKIWGERTFAEIGEILGISQNTAASRYRYGLEALKRNLSKARRQGDLSI